MAHETPPLPQSLPEQLLTSRHVGNIAAEAFPWLNQEADKPVAVAELMYPEGIIYVANGGTRRLNKISAEVRAHDSQGASGYDRLDEYFLRAARLELNGEAISSDRIQLVHTQAKRFSDLLLKDYREGNTPNARRIYYGVTHIGKYDLTLEPGSTVDPKSLLIVRLGASDKQHQVEFLHQLTGLNQQALKRKGAGK